MRSKAASSVLEVKDVDLKVGDKAILKGLRTTANSGDILAIMGPTGSGKTTLLNVIAGRQKADSGEVTLNGKDFNKRLRRRLAFVQQQDVFFTQLTLWETLYFTANIRLPETMSAAEKKQTIDDIVDTLDMRKCIDTIIGDRFVRGLSGGEKKRASIACELLTDPDILLLDEPTSGLDSSTAFSLMGQLKSYADKFNKTIITSIHQPSSQIFHMFSNLLLLVDGHEAYWGPANAALSHFEELDLRCSPHFNPADFLLEIVKSDKETVNKIIAHAEGKRQLTDTAAVDDLGNSITDPNNVTLDTSASTPAANGPTPGHAAGNHAPPTESAKRGDMKVLIMAEEADAQEALLSNQGSQPSEDTRERWTTSWFTQYKMLSWRCFKQTKGILFQGYTIVQALIVSLVAGIIYFQIPRTITTVRDTMGLIFFCVSYWTFNPAFETVNSFPIERPVISKERASGAYRLSTFYVAKATSDLPLVFIMPTVMYVLFYSMAGLGGVQEFFPTYFIILLQVLLSQAFGFVVGAATSDLRMALTTMVSYTLSAFLIGGFFTQNIPSWIAWAKYLSIILYPFASTATIIFSPMKPTLCNDTNVIEYPMCAENGTTHVYASDILEKAGITLPIHCYLVGSCVIIVILRIIGYFIFRFKKQVPL